ncbi:adenylate/guanylate cyclase domain-containing protein [Bradyrhizobium genosp. SA-3]|uniref:adenylate/guanylate cyclase domain-containing protein n=1 Tax=Bradyrhizobium genosp. SA-3 TaxID=508868 RepID=UPI001029FF1D|nr:adenylate/guanylate cyclase domain-containing protein [Bradyrhizobium genosp. SA-3]RZN11135.1 adenylate/guanylate cyclase domain-containing protein [Bradyrhizobium genosp. SA-3]
MTEYRKLAVIFAADVVGFSRMTGADEDRTLARLRALRSDLIDPTIAIHGGRVVKRTGDGALVEFRSVVEAVRCGIEIQNSMTERNAGLPPERRIEFRIGIHLGDVVEESDGDLMGDGVNIAARLEGVAQPGAICLSEDAYRQVKSRFDLAISDLGETKLKNIAEPMRIYSLLFGDAAKATVLRGAATPVAPGLSLPDKPSIAVLPFQNMSGDPEQEYFADGIVEDIITALSRFRQLFVIARNSSFVYKGRAVDVKQVSGDLGVRYVLEGSVRKAANRIRITAQLIDAPTGVHLWAERFDGGQEDIFDLQDQVTARVVGEIAPKLEQAEIERAKHKPTDSLDAYDYYLRGRANLNRGTRDATDEALSQFYQTLQIDPDFASAYAMAAWCHFWRKVNGWMTNPLQEIAEGARLGRRAVELGEDDAVALTRSGHALGHLAGDLDGSIDLTDKALVLNPNLASAWFLGGFLRVWNGEPDGAAEYFDRAMRLSPLDPEMYRMQAGMAMAHLFAGRFDTASSLAEKAFRHLPSFLMVVGIVAASQALAGHQGEAQRAMNHLRQLDPTLRLSNLADWLPIRRPKDLATFADGLQRAGLPE